MLIPGLHDAYLSTKDSATYTLKLSPTINSLGIAKVNVDYHGRISLRMPTVLHIVRVVSRKVP